METCLRAYGEVEARARFADPAEQHVLAETYSMTGLLHDFDYDQHPSLEEHPYVGCAILAEQGWAEEIRHAIMAHADYTGTPRLSHLDKALFACDELAGFLTACALIKPSKSIHDVEVAGVRKKLKDKAFARGVNRDDVLNGAAGLGVDLDRHIAFCLEAMQKNAAALEDGGARIARQVEIQVMGQIHRRRRIGGGAVAYLQLIRGDQLEYAAYTERPRESFLTVLRYVGESRLAVVASVLVEAPVSNELT